MDDSLSSAQACVCEMALLPQFLLPEENYASVLAQGIATYLATTRGNALVADSGGKEEVQSQKRYSVWQEGPEAPNAIMWELCAVVVHF